MKKAVAALLVSAAICSGSTLFPSSAPVGAVGGDAAVSLLDGMPPLRDDVPAWVPIMWINEGSHDADQFWITDVDSQDVDVAFPAYTEDPERPYLPTPGVYSSLFNDDVLASNEMDFTAIQVTVIGPNPVLDLRFSYLDPSGERVSRDVSIDVPIDDGSFSGEGVELATGELGPVQAGSIAWLDLHLTANTSISDVQLAVTSDALSIVYPSDARFAGLNNGSTLLERASDFGAVRFDTTGLQPDEYPIKVTATYKVGSQTHTTTVDRTVIVEA